MTESRVGFLHKIVSNLPQSESNESLKLLRSFYLMRCKEITQSYGLPTKHFSAKARCPHCCLEWTKKTDVKIIPIKLSSRQRRRIRTKKVTNANENRVNIKKALLQSNQMKQTCSFCKQTTVTTLPKPDKGSPKKDKTNEPITNAKSKQTVKPKETITKKNNNKDKKNKVEVSKKNTSNTNVYSNTFDVFSLKNNLNTLASTVKEPSKIIKNNKKKKDKFAGLCQKAVLASAKTKEIQKQDKGQQKVESKLSFFLKPLSG